MANRPLGAELVLSGVGPNRLTVGDPEVEVAGYAALGLRGGDARLAGMAHQEIHHDEVVAARRGGVLLDPHAQCVEAQFGIAHEGEQLGDGRGLHARERDRARRRARRAAAAMDRDTVGLQRSRQPTRGVGGGRMTASFSAARATVEGQSAQAPFQERIRSKSSGRPAAQGVEERLVAHDRAGDAMNAGHPHELAGEGRDAGAPAPVGGVNER